MGKSVGGELWSEQFSSSCISNINDNVPWCESLDEGQYFFHSHGMFQNVPNILQTMGDRTN